MIYYKDFKFPDEVPVVKSSQGTFINVPCSFDIETTSFYHNEEKVACMYIWQFGFDNTAVYGRTWDDFTMWMNTLHRVLKLSDNNLKLIVYVHNLGYEFQFLKGQYNISKLFAREKRRPMYFSIGNIQFKDSLVLSGMSLAKTLIDCKSAHSKTDGLDYSKMRHSKTPLTDEEMEYCENDVLGLNDFIRSEMKKNENDISKIPTTKTGYVRRYIRDKCLANPQYRDELNKQLTTDPYIFNLLQKCFIGAYTHGNNTKIGIKCSNVGSFDFTSSYPSVMIRHKYPCERFQRLDIISVNDILEMSKKYCTIMHITLYNVSSKNAIHPLSRNHCNVDMSSLVEDNGRIVQTSVLETNMTGVDFIDFMKCYNFTEVQVHDFYYAHKNYLPKEFIECILDFYVGKCTLKNVAGKEEEYRVSKGMLNASYGMCVTNPITPKVEYNNDTREWCVNTSNLDLGLELYKIVKNKKTFLNYAWGVFVTAYARHELFDGILTTIKDNDFIYADTDSMKVQNWTDYSGYIKDYNNRCTEEINACLDYYGIDRSRANPTGHNPLGVWDYEGSYEYFKTLGAKRYAYVKDGVFGYTISGLPNKRPNSDSKYAYDWITKDNPSGKYGLDFFTNKMYVPAEYSNKLTHLYVDKSFSCVLIDYLGTPLLVSENSYVHLEPQDFTLNFGEIFLRYLTGVDQSANALFDDIFSGQTGGLKLYG